MSHKQQLCFYVVANFLNDPSLKVRALRGKINNGKPVVLLASNGFKGQHIRMSKFTNI